MTDEKDTISFKKLLRKEENFQEEKYSNQEITLQTLALNPFKNTCDWRSEDGEIVLTFWTMNTHLMNQWENQAKHIGGGVNPAEMRSKEMDHSKPVRAEESVTIYTHNEFENNFDGPGIYLDSTHYGDRNYVDESYTIILPHEFMTEEMCREWIKALNDKYNRNLKLEEKDYKQRKTEYILDDLKQQEDETIQDIEEEKLEKIVDKIQETNII